VARGSVSKCGNVNLSAIECIGMDGERLLTPDSLETAHFNCGHPHRTGLVYKPRHAILVGQLLSSILAACSGVRPITLYN
jgi:hypothetical protein